MPAWVPTIKILVIEICPKTPEFSSCDTVVTQKRFCGGIIKFNILTFENYPGLSGQVQTNH